jgi:hypothetical protein
MIYENMLSGAFIYSLGVIAGKRSGVEVVDSINFFQQTPYDKPIGDLLADWGGKNFIVEFKKSTNEIKTEFRKEHKKKMLIELQLNDELVKLSRKCHFLAYGVQKEKSIEILFQYYLDAEQGKGISNSNFIDQLLRLDSEIGISKKEDMTKYLTFLMRFSKFSDVDAIFINISKEGRPIFLRIDNYLRLRLSLNHKVENVQNQSQDITRTPKKGLGLGR